ncbi:MAG: M6 family metalloprotease domain-containing protein [Phycisphaerales bacterium]|nr:M6 family metalloprotease domain-containing protein [Phycisphaerales bacterium]MCB9863664.1 M6 family metalloprotease domain-containing protein [Phycisphaerales bacterium]
MLAGAALMAAAVLLPAVRVEAAPAFGKVFDLRQPNGDVAPYRIWGDEYYQIVETLDGYTVVRDPDTEEICYADVTADGWDFVSTGVRVGAADPATLGLVPGMRITFDSERAKRMAARARFAVGVAETREGLNLAPGAPMPTPPSTGSVLGLTLVVDFSDEVGTIAISEIDNFLNQVSYSGNSNNGSVADYFFDVSDGNLTYTNNVPVAYYRAVNPKTYYDSNIAAGTKARELVLEALNALETAGHDFSQYDANSDGNIDAVNLFYAGTPTYGFAKGLWPHQWTLSPTFTADGKTATAYQITNIGTGLQMGTFCHESGHLLMGWPDLYDSEGDSSGVGDYDLMGTLAASAFDTNPPEPGAYLKELAGWANVNLLTTPATGLSLVAGTNTFYKFVNPLDSNEFFILENRQKTGRDASLPDAGIAIWHIDLNVADNNDQNHTTALHYQASLEQADGLFQLENFTNYGNAGDLYDSAGVTTFDDTTTPDSDWWDGSQSNLAISSVSANGATMTFSFDNGAGTPIELAVDTISAKQAGVTFSVGVNALDAFGDPGTVSADTRVTLSRKTGTGTLGGTLFATIAMGSSSATISGVTYDTVESGVVLTATASGGDTLTAADSNAFNVTQGPPSTLTVDTIAEQTADSAFDVTVNVEDNLGNATGVTAITLITLSRNTGTGTLSGTITGVLNTGESSVTISGVKYDTAETGVKFNAAASGPGGGSLSSAITNAFDVVAGTGSVLEIATISSPQIAHGPFDVGVSIVDSVGNPSTAMADTTVTLSVAAGTGTVGGVISGTILSGSGSCTISGVTYSKIGNNVRLRASASGYTSATSNTFNVGVGTASVLVVGSISTQQSGVGFDVGVSTMDAYGNTSAVTGDTLITLTRFAGTGSLGGTTTGTLTNGSSSFTISGVTYDTAESGVVIRAAASGFTNGDSSAFTVTAGAADRLAMATIGTQGVDVPFAVTVTSRDEFGQVSAVSSSTTVTLTKKSGIAASGTVSGNLSGVITSGTSSVTISGVLWDTAETGIQLTATASGGDTLTAIDSNSFAAEVRSATKLGFSTIANHAGGTPFDVTVNVLDAMDQAAAVTQDTFISVTLKTGTGSLYGTLSGTIAAGEQQIVFSDIDYDTAESGVVLKATASGGDTLTLANSNAFTITAGPAQILSPVDGSTLNSTSVTFQWNTGAEVTQYRLWVGTSPLNSATDANIYKSVALTGTSQVVTGIPTNGSTVYVKLHSYINSVFQATSFTYTAPSAGVATELGINTISTQTAGTPFTVTVKATDALGSLANVTQNTGVTLSKQTGTGTLSGTLTGTILSGMSSVAISGVSYSKAETGVVLRATRSAGDTLNAGNSAAFTVNGGAANKLSVETIADQGTGVGFDVVVNILDASDNPSVATQSTTITLTKKSGNMATGTLADVRTGVIAPGDGSVTISGVTWSLDATNAEVTATPTSGMTGLTPADSNMFDVATRVPTKLIITTIPNQGKGLPFDVTISAADSSDDLANVTSATQVTLALNAGTGTLGGQLTGTIANGESSVTISGVTYSAYENAIAIEAAATTGMTGLTDGVSNTFNVTTAKASLTSPAANGDTLTGSSYTFAWDTGAGVTQYRLWVGTVPMTVVADADIYHSLALTSTSQAVTGIPTDGSSVYVRLFSYINSVWQSKDYTFVAASAGVATHLELGTIATQVAGTSFSVGLTTVDALGDPATVTQDTRVALSVQTGTGAIGGTTYGTIASGTSSFTITGVTYDTAETGVVIRGTSVAGDTLIAVNSNAFTVNGGTASKLSIDTISDQGTGVGFNVVVHVLDANDNAAVATQATTITLTKKSGNAATGTVSGVTSGVVDPGNSSVTISGVKWSLDGTNCEITATPTSGLTGLTPANSNMFDVATRTPTKLAFTTVANQGTNLAFDVTIQALDSSDQPANVTMATKVTLARGSGTGTLGGVLTGTIANGTSEVTISGVTYNKTENSVTMTATPTTGMTGLTVGTSNAFNVGAKKASLTSPAADGDTLTGASYTFVWNTGSGVTQYRLWVGSGPMTVGTDADIYKSLALTGTSQAVSGIPTDGSNVYVRLFSYINSVWQSTDYTFVAASAGVATHLELGTIATQVAGTSFSIGLTSTDALGDPVAVTQDTKIALSIQTGTGSLGGTTYGTIPNGSSTYTIVGVTYSKAETGVVFRGTSVAGDTLLADNSNAFTVNGGAANKLSIETVDDQGTGVGFDVVVNILDASDNPAVATQSTTITLTKKSGNMASGTASGVLTGVIAPGDGSVTISGVKWTTAATSAELTATPTSGMTGLTAADSNTFDVTTRTPAKVAITTIANQGTNLPFDVVVQVLDSSDQPANVTSATQITLTRSAGTGTLGGVLTGTIANGTSEVTISGVTYNKTENSVTLTATPTTGMTALTVGVSNAFNVGTKKASMTTPAAEGDTLTGTSFTFVWNAGSGVTQYRLWVATAPMTSVADADIYHSLALTGTSQAVTGLPDDGSTVYVRLHSYINSVWQYNDYTYVAATAGTATHMQIVTIGTQTAGATFDVGVQVVDALGDPATVSQDTGVALSVQSGTGTLGGTTTGTIANGSSSFTISGVTYDKAETGVQLRATTVAGDSLFAVNSNAFTVSGGAATKLAIATIADQGTNVEFDVTVNINDANDNPAVASQTSTVTLTKKSGSAASGTIAGVTTGVIQAGGSSVTISGVKWDSADTGVELTATVTSGQTGLTAANSNMFDVSTRTPTKLAIETIPAQGKDQPFDVTVNVQDTGGDVANCTQLTTITLTVKTGTGAVSGVVSGTIAAGANSVTISGVMYDTLESGVVLTATASGGDSLTAADSNAFNVAKSAAVMTNPAADGDTLTSDTVTFTWTTGYGVTQYRLWVGTAPMTVLADADILGTLALSTTSQTVSGLPMDGSDVYVKLWSRIDNAWQSRDYTYTAAEAGVATKLTVSTISAQQAGVPFSVVVNTVDAFGSSANVSTDTSVSLSLATGTGNVGGTITATIVSGSSSATISGVTYDTLETGVQLRANRVTGDTLTAGVSNAFNVSAGVPTAMAFQAIPTQGAGDSFSVTVDVQDAYGNITNATMDTLITITKSPASSATGTLAGAVAGTVSSGSNSITLSGLSWDTIETGVSLRATASGGNTLTMADSATFTVTAGGPAKLSIATIADKTTSAVFSVRVDILDSLDNASMASQDTTITLTKKSGLSTTGTLGGTRVGTLVGGASGLTISGLTWNAADTGVVLTATASNGDTVTAGDSNSFTVTIGTPVDFTLTTVSGVEAGEPFDIGVTAIDQYGNAAMVTADTGIAMTLKNGTGSLGGVTAGTIPMGSATFTISGLTYSKKENNVRLTATVSGGDNLGSPTDTNFFNVVAGPAASLGFQTIAAQRAGVNFNVVVIPKDQFGNTTTVTLDTGVALTKKAGSSASGTLGGTLAGTITAGTGSVTIMGVNWDSLDSGVILTATRTGGDSLTAGDSNAFNVTAGPASLLALTVADQAAGEGFSVTVNATDSLGNAAAVTQDTVITLSKTSGSGASGTLIGGAGGLSGTILSGASSVVLPNLQWNVMETGVQITATRNSGDALTAGMSNTFTVTEGPPAKLAFNTISGQAAGTGFDVGVLAQDQFGNASGLLVDTRITISRSAGTGTVFGTVTGTFGASMTSFTISGVNYTAAESGVRLRAAASLGFPLTAGVSNSFTVTPGTVAAMTMDTIASQAAGVPFDVVVHSTDQFGNPTNATMDTGVALTLNTGSGTLAGTVAGTIANGTSAFTISGVTYDVAESGVVLTATASGGNALGTVSSNAFDCTGGAATALVVATVADQGIDLGFEIVVSVEDTYGNPTTVSADTGISITKKSGIAATGTAYGNLTGTILSGSSSATISGVKWDTAEGGVQLTVARTSGDTVTSDDTNAFTVSIRPPVKLGFSPIGTQSVNQPFDVVVEVLDTNDNPTVATQDTSITLSVQTGSGILSGTLTGVVLTGNSTFTFANLSYNTIQNGVALKATRTAGNVLTAGTSSAFNVAAGVKSVMTFPTNNGDTLGGANVTFAWTTGVNITQYRLWVGTQPLNSASDANIYRSLALSGTSQAVTGIPTDGSTIYVRLYSYINSVFESNDYTYTASGTPPSAPVATPPASGPKPAPVVSGGNNGGNTPSDTNGDSGNNGDDGNSADTAPDNVLQSIVGGFCGIGASMTLTMGAVMICGMGLRRRRRRMNRHRRIRT